MTVTELDLLDEAAARERLTACCGATPWVDAMLAARPWRDPETLRACADRAWAALSVVEVAQAIAHHPRLGESRAAAASSERARQWSASEQVGASAASDATRAALTRGNAEYERRFGHTFIFCAQGRNADVILAALHERLANDAATEHDITRAELHRITLMRLERLLSGA